MNNSENGGQNKDLIYSNPYHNDYRQIPEDLRKFVIPHSAEGPSTHELVVEKANFSMPVSFHIEDSDFYFTGVQNESKTGAIIWGNISGDLAKIKHFEIAKELKNKGISKAFITDLEDQLQKQGVKTVYCAFGLLENVDFCLHNGYKLISFDAIPPEQRPELEIDQKDFDQGIDNEETFKKWQKIDIKVRKKILMVKEF